jgi:hypothetical protein
MEAIALNQSKTPSTGSHARIRTGLGADVIAEALIDNLHCLQAKLPLNATRNDWYMALAYTCAIACWTATSRHLRRSSLQRLRSK